MDERMHGLEGHAMQTFLTFALAQPVKLEKEVGNHVRSQQFEKNQEVHDVVVWLRWLVMSVL